MDDVSVVRVRRHTVVRAVVRGTEGGTHVINGRGRKRGSNR